MTGARFMIRVQPRASENRIAGRVDDVWQVRVTAPPVEGEANEAVVALLAECLGVRKSAVRIERGAAGRSKRVAVDELTLDEVERRLEECTARGKRRR